MTSVKNYSTMKEPRLHPNNNVTDDRPLCIGIELGAKFSRVGLLDVKEQSGKEAIRILQNRNGACFTQSYISFPVSSEEPLVGEGLRNTTTDRVIYDACRNHDVFDPQSQTQGVENDLCLPCYAQYNSNNDWSYRIAQHDGESVTSIRQQEAIAEILVHLCDLAIEEQAKTTQRSSGHNGLEDCGGELAQQRQVTSAVIAIPAFSSDNYRRLVAQAAEIAGLPPHRTCIVAQSTAAVMAYMRECTREPPTLPPPANGGLLALVCMGASSLELSAFSMRPAATAGVDELMWSMGSAKLGGDAFTQALASKVLHYYGLNPANIVRGSACSNPDVVAWLNTVWHACEKAKEGLGAQMITKLSVDTPPEALSANSRKALNMDLSREKFQRICSPVYERVSELVKASFAPYGMYITQVVMVGGSSRLCHLDQIVRECVQRDDCHIVDKDFSSLVAEEAVVTGATLKAAILAGCGGEEVGRTDVPDFAYSSVELFNENGNSWPLVQTADRLPSNRLGVPFSLGRRPCTLGPGRYHMFQGCGDGRVARWLGELQFPNPNSKTQLYVIMDASRRIFVTVPEGQSLYHGEVLGRAPNLMTPDKVSEAHRHIEEKRRARAEEKAQDEIRKQQRRNQRKMQLKAESNENKNHHPHNGRPTAVEEEEKKRSRSAEMEGARNDENDDDPHFSTRSPPTTAEYRHEAVAHQKQTTKNGDEWVHVDNKMVPAAIEMAEEAVDPSHGTSMGSSKLHHPHSIGQNHRNNKEVDANIAVTQSSYTRIILESINPFSSRNKRVHYAYSPGPRMKEQATALEYNAKKRRIQQMKDELQEQIPGSFRTFFHVIREELTYFHRRADAIKADAGATSADLELLSNEVKRLVLLYKLHTRMDALVEEVNKSCGRTCASKARALKKRLLPNNPKTGLNMCTLAQLHEAMGIFDTEVDSWLHAEQRKH